MDRHDPQLHRRRACSKSAATELHRARRPHHRRGRRPLAGLDARRGRPGVRRRLRASASWKRLTPGRRQAYLLELATAIAERRDEISEVQARDTGQPVRYIASEEVDEGVDQLRFFAGAARLLEGKSAGEYLEGHTSSIRREPIGVVGQVTPWNYPFAMAIWKIAPALAAGNTIVLKPSDTTPRSTCCSPRSSRVLPPACSISSQR